MRRRSSAAADELHSYRELERELRHIVPGWTDVEARSVVNHPTAEQMRILAASLAQLVFAAEPLPNTTDELRQMFAKAQVKRNPSAVDAEGKSTALPCLPRDLDRYVVGMKTLVSLRYMENFCSLFSLDLPTVYDILRPTGFFVRHLIQSVQKYQAFQREKFPEASRMRDELIAEKQAAADYRAQAKMCFKKAKELELQFPQDSEYQTMLKEFDLARTSFREQCREEERIREVCAELDNTVEQSKNKIESLTTETYNMHQKYQQIQESIINPQEIASKQKAFEEAEIELNKLREEGRTAELLGINALARLLCLSDLHKKLEEFNAEAVKLSGAKHEEAHWRTRSTEIEKRKQQSQDTVDRLNEEYEKKQRAADALKKEIERIKSTEAETLESQEALLSKQEKTIAALENHCREVNERCEKLQKDLLVEYNAAESAAMQVSDDLKHAEAYGAVAYAAAQRSFDRAAEVASTVVNHIKGQLDGSRNEGNDEPNTSGAVRLLCPQLPDFAAVAAGESLDLARTAAEAEEYSELQESILPLKRVAEVVQTEVKNLLRRFEATGLRVDSARKS